MSLGKRIIYRIDNNLHTVWRLLHDEIDKFLLGIIKCVSSLMSYTLIGVYYN